MRERLVDVVEVHALATVVALNCLQTGDIAKEGGSGQTAKHKDAVFAAEFTERKLSAFGVPCFDIGELFALKRQCSIT